MGDCNCAEESLKGSPDLRLSMLRSVSGATEKLKKRLVSYICFSFSMNPVWLISKAHNRGAV